MRSVIQPYPYKNEADATDARCPASSSNQVPVGHKPNVCKASGEHLPLDSALESRPAAAFTRRSARGPDILGRPSMSPWDVRTHAPTQHAFASSLILNVGPGFRPYEIASGFGDGLMAQASTSYRGFWAGCACQAGAEGCPENSAQLPQIRRASRPFGIGADRRTASAIMAAAPGTLQKRPLRDRIAEATANANSTTTAKPMPAITTTDQCAAHLLGEFAKLGHAAQVVKLLQSSNRPAVEAIDSAFLTAVEHGHESIVHILASHISPIVRLARHGDPATVLAARSNSVACLSAVVERCGTSVDLCNANGRTALHIAAEHDYADIAQWLVDHDADLNAADNDGVCPLHVASMNKRERVLRILLDNEASLSLRNKDGATPLDVAYDCEVVRIVLSHAARSGLHTEASERIDCSGFDQLRAGPVAVLFWSAIGVGRDNAMFQQLGVYPFDRLNDTERIVVLTEVCERIAGYRQDIDIDVLRDSALFAVFAMMKLRVKKEIDAGNTKSASSRTDDDERRYGWRRKIVAAYEHLLECDAADAGLSVECTKRIVWSTIVNLLAQHSAFGSTFWDKRRVFSCVNVQERPRLLTTGAPDNYWASRLPTTSQLSQGVVQLTFKKLMTMSKTFLAEESLDSNGCFCQDCVAEREVPLTFKLRFLDETAECKRDLKKGIVKRTPCCDEDARLSSAAATREQVDELLLSQNGELCKFWSNLTTEEKWALTEMTTTELADLIAEPGPFEWETLRAALTSYTQYQWEEDSLEINDDCITIADEISETKDLNDLIHIMIEAAVRILRGEGADVPVVPVLPPIPLTCSAHASECLRCVSEEEWDRRGRQLLENIVLCEFARRIAAQYLVKKEESRAQRIALEHELELLREVEQLERKERRKKAKSRRKRGRRAQTRPAVETPPETRPAAAAAAPAAAAPSSPSSASTPSSSSSSSDDVDSDGEVPIALPSSVLLRSNPKQPAPAKSSRSSVRPSGSSPAPSPSYTGGMMFICTDDTYDECQALGIFGLPRQHLASVVECRPGGSCALFLFNITTRYLYGLFEPSAPGADLIDPTAWARPRGGPTPFPAQVRYKQVGPKRPGLPESAFRHIFPDGNRIRKLTGDEVRDLLQTWDTFDPRKDSSAASSAAASSTPAQQSKRASRASKKQQQQPPVSCQPAGQPSKSQSQQQQQQVQPQKRQVGQQQAQPRPAEQRSSPRRQPPDPPSQPRPESVQQPPSAPKPSAPLPDQRQQQERSQPRPAQHGPAGVAPPVAARTAPAVPERNPVQQDAAPVVQDPASHLSPPPSSLLPSVSLRADAIPMAPFASRQQPVPAVSILTRPAPLPAIDPGVVYPSQGPPPPVPPPNVAFVTPSPIPCADPIWSTASSALTWDRTASSLAPPRPSSASATPQASRFQQARQQPFERGNRPPIRASSSVNGLNLFGDWNGIWGTPSQQPPTSSIW